MEEVTLSSLYILYETSLVFAFGGRGGSEELTGLPSIPGAPAQPSFQSWHCSFGFSHLLSVGDMLFQAEGQRWVTNGPSLWRLLSRGEVRHVTVVATCCDRSYSKTGWWGCLRYPLWSWADNRGLNLGYKGQDWLAISQSLYFLPGKCRLSPQETLA